MMLKESYKNLLEVWARDEDSKVVEEAEVAFRRELQIATPRELDSVLTPKAWMELPADWIRAAYSKALNRTRDRKLARSYLEFLNFVGGPDYDDEKAKLKRLLGDNSSR